jgi:TonB family protein
MRSRWTKIVLGSVGATLLSGTLGFAQSASTDEGKRKVKTRVSPAYPELAKRMSVTGKVKIEVIIASDGHVKSTKAIGGHPLLVQACQDAVKEWKFLPAPEESTQIVEFEFTGANN